jgi:hypothetical protein
MTLYIAHSEHIARGQPWVIAATIIVLLAGTLILWIVHKTGGKSSWVPEVLLAFGIGGELANGVEIIARGSVTDIIGIHEPGGGIYSAGDIATGMGISLLIAAAFFVGASNRGRITRLTSAAVAYSLIIAIALVLPYRVGLAFLATGVAIISTAVFGARDLAWPAVEARRRR